MPSLKPPNAGSKGMDTQEIRETDIHELVVFQASRKEVPAEQTPTSADYALVRAAVDEISRVHTRPNAIAAVVYRRINDTLLEITALDSALVCSLRMSIGAFAPRLESLH